MPPELPIVAAIHQAEAPLVARRGPGLRRREALRGVKFGMRGHAGFAVLVFTSAVIGAGAIALSCDVWEWALLIGGVGTLFAAELFHGSIRHVIQHVEAMPEADRERCGAMAAGAALVVRLSVMAVALVLFVSRLTQLLHVYG
jgi:diacylglycerol kinase